MNSQNFSLETKMNIGPHSGNIYRALRSKFSEDELATVSIKDEESALVEVHKYLEAERLDHEAMEKEKRETPPSKIKDKGDPIPPTSEYLKGGIEQMLIPSSIQWHVHLIEYADDYAVFSIPDCLPGSKIIEDRLDGERDNPGLKLTSPAFKVEEVDQSDHLSDTHRLIKVFCTNDYIDRIHARLMYMAYNKHLVEDIMKPQKKRCTPIFFPPERPKIDESIELLELEKKFVQHTDEILQTRLDFNYRMEKCKELREQTEKRKS